MNFHTAMHSRVVLIYLAIFAGLLLAAGAVLSWLTWVKRKDVSSHRARIFFYPARRWTNAGIF
jgi:hypothetical protein